MKARPVRYRLDPGERFAIVGTAHVRVALRQPALPWSTLAELDTRYVIDCEVSRAHDDETATIGCVLRELRTEVRSPLGGLRVPARRSRWRAVPWLWRWARHLAACPGEHLDVRKSLYGDIVWVTTDRHLRRAMVGIDPDSILRWYGGLFPRDRRPTTQTARLDFAPSWLGLPVPGRVPVEVQFRYHRRRRRALFEGRRLPTFGVDMALEAVPQRLGPLTLRGRGTGEGTTIADTDRGKIARSQRTAQVLLDLEARGRRLAQLSIAITSDAWHEEHPPETDGDLSARPRSPPRSRARSGP